MHLQSSGNTATGAGSQTFGRGCAVALAENGVDLGSNGRGPPVLEANTPAPLAPIRAKGDGMAARRRGRVVSGQPVLSDGGTCPGAGWG